MAFKEMRVLKTKAVPSSFLQIRLMLLAPSYVADHVNGHIFLSGTKIDKLQNMKICCAAISRLVYSLYVFKSSSNILI